MIFGGTSQQDSFPFKQPFNYTIFCSIWRLFIPCVLLALDDSLITDLIGFLDFLDALASLDFKLSVSE